MNRKSLGIYIHIPFCVQKCLYCDFVSEPASIEIKRNYVNCLLEEIEVCTYGNKSGRKYIVDTIFIGGKAFRGVELRQKLGLYSTAFSVVPAGDMVHIYTRGFGHRVGMSQYGAEAMAVSGSDYTQILNHYYPGTELVGYLD
mgnify:CR=1 FL=1